MNLKDSQVRLTVELEGRLTVTTVKTEHGLVRKILRQPCVQSVNLNNDCVANFISKSVPVARVTTWKWEKMSDKQRLEAHLQILADDLAHKNHASFTYQIIE